MKHLLLFFFISLLFSCTGSVFESAQYGENYKHSEDKYQRAGYGCEFATLVIVNKTDAVRMVNINRDSSFMVPAKGKLRLNLQGGFNLIEDDFDRIKLDCVPCLTYTHTYR